MDQTARPPSPGAARAALRFPKVPRRVDLSLLARGLVFALVGTAAVSTGFLAVTYAMSDVPLEGFGGRWGFVFLMGVACFVASVIMFEVLLIRSFRVVDGVMTLPGPVRRRGGGPMWRVRLEDIVSAERLAQPPQDPEVRITLRDGTTFYLRKGVLPSGGGFFLDQLVHAIRQDAEAGGAATSDAGAR